MVIAVVLTGAAVIATLLSVVFVVFRAYRREKQVLTETITGYFNAAFVSPDKDKPSYFATLVDIAGAIIANNIVTAVKSTFMGIQSGANRGEKALEGAIAQDMLSQSNPLIGSILNSFPAASKVLRKNPGLAPLAQALMERFIKPGGGGNGNGKQAAFKDSF